MADQRHVASTDVVVPGVPAADPDAVTKIVESHAVGAADDQAGGGNFLRHPLAQQGFCITREYQIGHHGGGFCAVGDDVVQCSLDVGVTHRKYDVVDVFGQGNKVRETRNSANRLISWVYCVEFARIPAGQQVFHGLSADRVRSFAGADNSDGCWPEQRVQVMFGSVHKRRACLEFKIERGIGYLYAGPSSVGNG